MRLMPNLPDPIALFDKFKIPTEFVVFGAVPAVSIAAGYLLALTILKRSRLRSRHILAWAAGFLCSVAILGFVNYHYVLTFPESRCKGAGPEGFTTLAPVFLPDDFKVFAPDGASFDALTCVDFDQIMRKNARPGLAAAIGLLVASLGATALFVGLIFGGAYRAWKPAADT
jgi:hypothetical protein